MVTAGNAWADIHLPLSLSLCFDSKKKTDIVFQRSHP